MNGSKRILTGSGGFLLCLSKMCSQLMVRRNSIEVCKSGRGRGWDPLKNPIKDPIFKKISQSVPSKDPYKNPMMGPIKDLTFKVSYQRILLGMAFKDRLKGSHQIPETEGQSIPIEGRRPVSGSQGSPPINQQSPISSPLAATFCPLTSTTVIDNQ